MGLQLLLAHVQAKILTLPTSNPSVDGGIATCSYQDNVMALDGSMRVLQGNVIVQHGSTDLVWGIQDNTQLHMLLSLFTASNNPQEQRIRLMEVLQRQGRRDLATSLDVLQSAEANREADRAQEPRAQ